VFLLVIRELEPGDEIARDYPSTLSDRSWQMLCCCGTFECRGVIGAAAMLSPERQEWFGARSLVAPNLRRRDRVSQKVAA
jgi:hypothetical protein